MTNGEKIKEVFPSIELYEKSHDAIQINFDSVWWNAEYKEPTTKNDLGVDCISRKAVLDELGEWDWQELYLPIHFKENIVDVLPSVTPQEPILDKIYADIQRLRGCSCSCSDGIIDDVEDILDKYKAESEDT